MSAGKTLTEFAPTEEEASRGKDALANLNLMQVGEHARWFQPVREGDSLSLRTFYIDCVLRGSEASGWVAISTFRQVFWNQRGEVVSLWDIDAIHPYNQPKVDFVPPPRSSDYLEGIDAAYDAEEVRGPLARSVESVSVGDELPKITKGPLVSSDVVAWAQGCGRHDLAPNRLGRKKRRAGEQAYMQNKAGGWDSYMSCHWDASVSSAFGMQQPFDWGIMRCCYMMHIVSDWMGERRDPGRGARSDPCDQRPRERDDCQWRSHGYQVQQRVARGDGRSALYEPGRGRDGQLDGSGSPAL